MIQAIVFLPLIGAILAGLISIFGAHARNPSGDTSSIMTTRMAPMPMRRMPMTMPMPPTITATTTIMRSSRRRRARARPN